MGRTKRDAGGWLVTYSDLVTLLLVFFVILYILTPGVDDSTFNSFLSYFQGSTGIMDQTSIVEQARQDREEYRNRIMDQWQVVEDFLDEQGLSSQVDIVDMEGGVKITLDQDLTFNSGSSELLPQARLVLEQVAGAFSSDLIAETEVQGHTDNVPVSQSLEYRSNWHLGAARAVSVLLYLQEMTDLEPEQFLAVSYGEYQPVALNTTPEGRRQNRRVEIYVRYKGFSTIEYDFSDRSDGEVEFTGGTSSGFETSNE